MESFGRGFLGCFGVAAAVVVMLLALVMCSAMNANHEARRVDTGAAQGRDFQVACISALVRGYRYDRRLRGAEYAVGEDPTILEETPPQLVACPFNSPRGAGIVKIRINCSYFAEGGCWKLESVVFGRDLR